MNETEHRISPSDALCGETAAAEQQSRRLFRRLLIVLILSVAGLLVILGAVALILKLTEEPAPDFRFYPVSEEDIMKNEDYLAKDRYMYFTDGNGVTERVDEEYLSAYPDDELQFVYEYLQTVIRGDEGQFRLFFSETYYKKNKPQEAFTQQMLCNIRVCVYKIEDLGDGERLVTYKLTYDIYRNNGTYRNDCAPEKESPEFIAVRVSDHALPIIDARYFYREVSR